MTELTDIPGAVCAAQGFRVAAVATGMKRSGDLDLALIVSDHPASAAGVFTRHRAAAAPVLVSRQRLAGGRARGIVVNAGCANAVTGARGLADAEAMADAAAASTGLDAAEMLVCSTGKIGSFLPMDQVVKAIGEAAGQLGTDDTNAAHAILTTDTRAKTAAVAHPAGWRLGGMAKGAGMIAPDMATMLAFVTTDAVVEADFLQRCLASAVEDSFNAITVDGECSTNDTVLVLANGASGVEAGPDQLHEALSLVCSRLARAIAEDGEGATKLVRVVVTGARSVAEARRAARAVAESPLLKCALYGSDANWGRVAAAVAGSEAAVDLEGWSIDMGGVRLLDRGVPVEGDAEGRARKALRAREIEIRCDLAVGDAEGEILTTDFSPHYVDINAAYEP